MIRWLSVLVALSHIAAAPALAVEFEKLPLVNSVECLGITEDGKFLVLGHKAEDSISIMDMATLKVVKEVDCRQPAAIVCRGDKVLVANCDEDGTVSVFSRKEDWDQVDEVEVGQANPQLMSAPGGSYFKGTVILKCRGTDRYEIPIMAVDINRDRHAEITKGYLSNGMVDFTGRYFITQGPRGSPSRSIAGVLDFQALSAGRKVEVAGRNFDTLPILYQVAKGPFWWGGDHIYKGMPPRAVGEAYGHILIPDRMVSLCYAFDERYMTCLSLDGAMTEIAKLQMKWPERFQASPRKGPLFTTDRVEDSHKHLAATVDGQFHCFVWSKEEQCVYHATREAFSMPQEGASDGTGQDVAGGTMPDGSPAVFPLRVGVGQQIEYRVAPAGTQGEFRVIDAPKGVRISNDGLLSWAPTRADIGVQRIKIRAMVGGSSKFVRLSTEVVQSTGTGRSPRASGAAKPPAAKPPAVIRTWRDRTGEFGILAELVNVTAGKVKLRRVDGKEVDVPIDRLSDADQEYLRKIGDP